MLRRMVGVTRVPARVVMLACIAAGLLAGRCGSCRAELGAADVGAQGNLVTDNLTVNTKATVPLLTTNPAMSFSTDSGATVAAKIDNCRATVSTATAASWRLNANTVGGSGSISARGGNGGIGDPSSDGGGGGGGGGGVVVLVYGSGTPPTVNVAGGTGGAGGTTPDTGGVRGPGQPGGAGGAGYSVIFQI